jgi:two-component system chemotaxis response regulator CheY
MKATVTLLRAELVRGTTTIVGHTTVVTPTRAFVRTDELFDLGTSVEVLLSFPGALPPLKFRGVVIEHRLPSGPGLGSGLWLELEAQSTDDQARLSSVLELAPSSAQVRVLMVEDSALTRDVFRHVARSTTRVSVDTVADAEEAWAKLETGNYHLLVADHFLSSDTGADLIARVRAHERLHALPIVGISVGGKVARDAMLSAGVDLFLEKPVDVRQLMHTIDRLDWLEESAA